MKYAPLLFLALAAGCKSSIDFDQGRPYSCEPEGGDASAACGTAWRCGVDGRCHAIGDAQPWPCRASSDCEAAWVCGLEKTCHDPAVAADYLCLTDVECTAPWRCGFAGRCLDATAELGAVPASVPTDVVVLAPHGFTGQFDGVVAADLEGNVAVGVGDHVRWIGRRDGGWSVVDFDAGPWVKALMVDSRGAYTVSDEGVRVLLLEGPQELLYVPDGGPWFVGQARGPFLVEGGEARPLGTFSFIPTPIPLGAKTAAIGNCYYFTTDDGLWMQQHGRTDEPSPISLSAWPQRACGLPPTDPGLSQEIVRIGGSQRQVLALAGYRPSGAEAPWDGGGIGRPALPPLNFVAAVDLSRLSDVSGPFDPPGTGPCVLPQPIAGPRGLQCPSARVTALFDCPVPCELGDELTDLRPSDRTVEVECTGGLGQTTWSMPNDGTCTAEQLTGRSSRYHVVRTPGEQSLSLGSLVQRGPNGQVWRGPQISSATSVFLDEAPVALMRPRFLNDAGVAPLRPVTLTGSAQFVPEGGLIMNAAPEMLAYAAGALAIGLTRSGTIVTIAEADGGSLVSTGRLTALDVLPLDLKSPYTLTSTTRASDAGVLVATVGDGLYSADRASWSKKMPLRVVPQPGFGITSVALTPGPGVQGFLSTRSGAFAFASSSEVSWTVSPIPMPPGQMLEVWSDRGFSRVGFSDGRVLTLPSGVPLVGPRTDLEFVDYLGACGQIYGLTRDGVLRLGAQGWEPQELPGADAVINEFLSGGKLFEQDGLIYLFNGAGGGLTFRPSSGCR